jgi:hypothetical protein
MKKYIALFILSLLTAYPFAAFGQGGVEADPAYLPIDKLLDLKAIQPEVNINLPRFLLKDALTELNAAGTNSALDGIDIADLIKDLKLIRVVVIEAKETNRPALDKAVKALREELEKKWTAIVSVPEEKEHVGIYAMPDPAGESNAGLAVLVYDGGDAVIGNVVGHVSIGKLIKLASASNKVPKELLKKLQGVGNATTEAKSGDGSSANAAGAGPKTAAEDAAPK